MSRFHEVTCYLCPSCLVAHEASCKITSLSFLLGNMFGSRLFLLTGFIVTFLQAEFSLPEQFKSTWNGKTFVTTSSESLG